MRAIDLACGAAIVLCACGRDRDPDAAGRMETKDPIAFTHACTWRWWPAALK
jgi:hypothetical protein